MIVVYGSTMEPHMIHMVKVTFQRSEYLGSSREESAFHLVFAAEGTVRDKVEEFYALKTTEYGTYYHLTNIEIMTNIGAPVIG